MTDLLAPPPQIDQTETAVNSVQNPIGVPGDVKHVDATGLPLDVVARNRDQIEQDNQRSQLKKIFDNNPGAQTWVNRDEANATMVADDPSFLSTMADALVKRPIIDPFVGGAVNTKRYNLLAQSIFRPLTPEEQADMSHWDAMPETKIDTTSGNVLSAAVKTTANTLPMVVEQGWSMLAGGAAGASLGALTLNPASIVGGAAIGSGVGGALYNFNQMTGMAVDQLSKVRGFDNEHLDPNVIKGASVAAGIVNAGIGLIPLGSVVKNIPGVSNLPFGKLLSPLTDALNKIPGFDKITEPFSSSGMKKVLLLPGAQQLFFNFGKRVAEITGTMGLAVGAQSAVNIAATEAAKAASDGNFKPTTFGQAAEDVATSAYAGALGGVGIGAAVGTVNVPFDAVRQRSFADDATAQAQSINEAVRAKADVIARSPDRFYQLAKDMAGNDRFYIDPQPLFDTLNKLPPDKQEALFNAMPGLKEELTTALATDADIAISKADYASFIAPHPEADELAQHLKLDPEDMSVAEKNALAEFYKNNPEQAKALDAMAKATPETVPGEAVNAVERVVRKAMIDAGRTNIEARAVAPLFAHTLSRFAAPLGMDAIEHMTKNMLEFQTLDSEGKPVKVGNSMDIFMRDLDAVNQGKTVPGLDANGLAAVKSFGAKMTEAGITPEQARTMTPRDLLDVVYPKPPQGSFSFDVPGAEGEPSGQGVNISPGEDGSVNLSLKNPEQDAAKAAERQAVEDKFAGAEEEIKKLSQLSTDAQKGMYGISGFYSKMYRYLDEKLNKTGTVDQYKKQIDAAIKNGQFKADEYEWSGLGEFLDMLQPDQKIDKEAITSWLDDNKLSINEKVYTQKTDRVKVPINKRSTKTPGDEFDRSDYPTEDDVQFSNSTQREPDSDTVHEEQNYYVERMQEDEDPEEWYKDGNNSNLVEAENLDANGEPTDETTYKWDEDKMYDYVHDQAYESASQMAGYEFTASVGDYEYEVYYEPDAGYSRIRRYNGVTWSEVDEPTGRTNEENLRSHVVNDMLEQGAVYSEDQVNEMEQEFNDQKEEERRLLLESQAPPENLPPADAETVTPEQATSLLQVGEKGVRLVSDYEDMKFYTEFDIPYLQQALAQGSFGERRLVPFENDANTPLSVDLDTAKQAFAKGYNVFVTAHGVEAGDDTPGWLNIGAAGSSNTTRITDYVAGQLFDRGDKKYHQWLDDGKIKLSILPKGVEVEGVDFRYEDRKTGYLNWEQYQMQGPHGDQHEIVIQLPKIEDTGVSQHNWRGADGNILMHMRFSERKNDKGEKTLFIDEVQSDWHQQGTEKGYATNDYEPTWNITDRNGNAWADVKAKSAQDAILKFEKEIAPTLKGHETHLSELIGKDQIYAEQVDEGHVARAPFAQLNKYTELAMKRMILWAAGHGYDRVAWTTGEQQAARWSSLLQRTVDKIEVFGKSDGFIHLSSSFRGKNHSEFVAENAKGGKYTEGEAPGGGGFTGFASIPEEGLAPIFGKEISEQIKERATREQPEEVSSIPESAIETSGDNKRVTFPDGQWNLYDDPQSKEAIDTWNKALKNNIISGVNIKVNAKGMIEVYDKVMVNIANGIIKKFGSKVDVTKIDTNHGQTTTGGDRGGSDTRETEQWSFPVTDKMKESVQEGFPLFQRERGYIQFEDALRKVVVAFTSGANMSTAVHEFAHFAVAAHRQFADLAKQKMAQGVDTYELRRIIDDWEKLKEQVGATSDKFGVNQEEKIAHQFEAYMREGVAPSEELRHIFSRFRDWMVKIYKDIKDLLRPGEELNDEMRGIFNRWLASEEATAKVQEKNAALAEIAQNAGLPPDIVTKIADYVNSATMQAEEKIYREMTAEQKRRETKAYQDEFAKTRAGIAQEMVQQREYNLLKYMRDNGLKFIEGIETSGLPEDLVTSKEDDHAVHPDNIAELYGYDSGIDMLKTIKKTPDFDRTVDNATRQKLMDKYPDMVAQGRIQMKASSAILNDRVLLALDLMIKELGKAHGGVNRVGMKQFAKAIAQNRVHDMKQTEASYAFRYDVAREKSIRDALKASRKGDHTGAMVNLQKAMVNQAIFKALEEFTETKKKAQELFDKVNRRDESIAGGRDIDFVGAARYIMSKFGLGDPDRSFDVTAWMEDLALRDKDVYDDILELSDIVATLPKPEQELTVGEYLDIYDAVDNIFHVARTTREIEREGKKIKLDALVQKLTEKIDIEGAEMFAGTQIIGKRKISDTILSLGASMRQVEEWCIAYDGGERGAMWNNIWKPISVQVDRYTRAKNAKMKELRAILKEHNNMLHERRKISSGMFKKDRFGRTTEMVWNDAMEMVGFMLHTGNESNLDKVLGGWGIERSAWEAAKESLARDGTMKREHWELVGKLWKLADDLKPLTQKSFKSMYGHRFEEIEVTPVTIHFREGGEFKTDTVPGGYWPAIADSSLAENAKTLEQILENAKTYSVGMTKRGFTKRRVSGYKQPLVTDLRLASSHIDAALKFAYIGPAARDVYRIINHKEFKGKISIVDKYAHSNMLEPWLGRTANQLASPPAADTSAAAGAKVMNYIQKASAMQLMGYNLSVALQNVANVFPAIHMTGMSHFMHGFYNLVTSPIETRRQVMDASPMMQRRLTMADEKMEKEIHRIMTRGGYFRSGQDFLVANSRVFIIAVDNVVATAAWNGEYIKAQEEGMTQEEAVHQADSVMRRSMGGDNPKDVSRLEASSPAVKFLMPFVSYFLKQYNVSKTEFGAVMEKYGWAGTPRMFGLYFSMIMAPAIVGQYIADGLKGNLPGDKDDGEMADWISWLTRAQVKYLSAFVPFAGQTLNALIGTLVGSPPGSDRTSLSPVASMIDGLLRTVRTATSDNSVNEERLLMDAMTTLGVAAKVPLGQIAKPTAYAYGVQKGDINPQGGADVARGLVSGPPHKN